MTDDALREQAASWVLLHQFDEMTPTRRAAFDAWLTDDPDARGTYRHVERMWRLSADPAIAADATPRSIYRGGSRHLWHPRRWIAGAVAASVALLMTAVPERIVHYVDVGLAPVRGGGQMISTGAGRRSSARLADGTIVTLDGDTRLRVLEMGARRRVDLIAGHAFFQVAKDPRHPFLVTAMNKTVRALGTAFDVRVGPDAVAVTLVEGKVRVDQARGLWRAPIATDMAPGRRLVAANDQVWLMTPVDPAMATSWFNDRLAYDEETIATIVADVNAGSARKIVFTGPLDGQARLVGVFRRGDVDTLATVLELKGVARVVARRDGQIEMAPFTP